MINVLIVEDSIVVRELLKHIFNSDPEINVIGTACNGREAVDFVQRTKPDVITMDIIMPVMNGFEATRAIMETCPVPIVIVSASWDPQEVEKTFQAIEAGAVAALEKPRGMGDPRYEEGAKEIIETIKLMSEVKVIKRMARDKKKPVIASTVPAISSINPGSTDIKIVTIGASTGGPQTLHTILSLLRPDFPVPITIVQHIAAGFVTGFIDWLNRSLEIPVQLATKGEKLLKGRIYMAPDGFHFGVDEDGRVKLSDTEKENFVCPSVSYMFRSILGVYGKSAIGVLLTGMGKDGAEELKLMKDSGAITIAQDKESSVVHGMPGEAIKIGGAVHILPPVKIAEMLNKLVAFNK